MLREVTHSAGRVSANMHVIHEYLSLGLYSLSSVSPLVSVLLSKVSLVPSYYSDCN